MLALWTGFTFVGYFSPIRELTLAFLQTRLGSWELFWILFYGFATYGNAGWMREQVCKYMCPYARFQSVMFDRDTLVITYDEKRGEPRGGRAKKTDLTKANLGDCVDCNICVQVCPTDIDIRKGLQYECIGCAACIDGCNQVMDKMGYPRGLIRYTTENALENNYSWKDILRRTFRPRILIYSGILWAIIIGATVAISMRTPVKMDVIRDRITLARQVEKKYVENVYQLRVMNTQEIPHHFIIRTEGLQDLSMLNNTQALEIGATTSKIVPVRLRVNTEHVDVGSHPIYFVIEAIDNQNHPTPEIFSVREKSIFVVPRK